jgi:hypothetical protein
MCAAYCDIKFAQRVLPTYSCTDFPLRQCNPVCIPIKIRRAVNIRLEARYTLHVGNVALNCLLIRYIT